MFELVTDVERAHTEREDQDNAGAGANLSGNGKSTSQGLFRMSNTLQ